MDSQKTGFHDKKKCFDISKCKWSHVQKRGYSHITGFTVL